MLSRKATKQLDLKVPLLKVPGRLLEKQETLRRDEELWKLSFSYLVPPLQSPTPLSPPLHLFSRTIFHSNSRHPGGCTRGANLEAWVHFLSCRMLRCSINSPVDTYHSLDLANEPSCSFPLAGASSQAAL